jgi:hypothetical protein
VGSTPLLREVNFLLLLLLLLLLQHRILITGFLAL